MFLKKEYYSVFIFSNIFFFVKNFRNQLEENLRGVIQTDEDIQRTVEEFVRQETAAQLPQQP